MIITTRNTLRGVCVLGAAAMLVAGCGGSPTLESRDVQVDSSYSGGAVDNVLVLSVQEDRVHDSRVVIERGFVQQMKAAGIDATAGYALFDSVDELLRNPQSFEPKLAEAGIASVLFIDPIRLDTDYDPGEYAQRRSAYRAIGFDNSATINLISDIAADASAAKVVMNVGLWLPGSDTDLFNSTYDINAPGNYDIDAARVYAAGFADAVIADLRQHGFVN